MRPLVARRLLAGLTLLTTACVLAPVRTPLHDINGATQSAEVEAWLGRAASNWNRGDLDAFLGDYLPGDETTYTSGRGVLRGATAIKAAYAPRFSPSGLRDSLSFELIDVDPLAPDVLNVIAMWQLTRHLASRDSITGRGPTSLLMRHVGGRWRIAHDHSS